MKIKTFGPVDERSRKQLETCMQAGDAEFGVLCADHHPGYSQPIGGAVAYEGYVSPTGVGWDIGCGNKAVRTNLTAADVDVAGVMDEVARRISFGMGVPSKEEADHPVLDKIREASFEPQRELYDLAAKQLGTVGGGNHYVNVFADEDGTVWVGVHFGSRGFGHKTAGFFMSEGGMDSAPTLLPIDTESGQAYIEAMQLAGEYAYAGRDVVVEKMLEILGAESTYEVHNHHNYSWKEQHFGRTYWVVRKGCTPAQPGQEGFVGGSMGEPSVILEGAESQDATESLYSTVHGAGRVMSRSQAAGRVKRRTVYECSERDCSFSVPAKAYQGEKCPEHPHRKMRKVRKEELVRKGLVDWEAVKQRLAADGIVVLGGGADEAPEVYKRLPEVLAAHGDSIRVKHTLTPLGVAMAGAEVFDPYKD